MYCIDKNFLGTKQHMLVSTTNSFVEEIPSNCLIENGLDVPGTVVSFAKIAGEELDILPENIRRSLLECNIPIFEAGLKHLLQKKDFESVITQYLYRVNKVIEKNSEYLPTYLQNVTILNSCLPAKFKVEPEGISIDLEGFAAKVRYDTTGTKTGRMSVISGPSVLTLKRGFKECLVSRFDGGRIVEIDYSALEPRTALALAGSDLATADDVYLEIGDHLGISDRETAKQVIISFLYGAAVSTICRIANISKDVLSPKLKNLKKMFKYDETIFQISSQLTKSNSFRNHAGRQIFPNSSKSGTLFNNFCQSTAVDVALSGFGYLLDEIKKNSMSAYPVYFIHDAVLLDIPAGELDKMQDISSALPTYLGLDFPTKFKFLDN